MTATTTARRRALVAVVAVLLVGSGLQVSQAAPRKGASVPTPTVTGPIPSSQGSHGRPQTDMAFDLKPYGFVEEEYFVSGTARSYSTPPTKADYTTRMLVRRPADRKKFNGTVIVEWNNVTAQHDQSQDWFWSYPLALREGFAYVIVSTQAAGICCAPRWRCRSSTTGATASCRTPVTSRASTSSARWPRPCASRRMSIRSVG